MGFVKIVLSLFFKLGGGQRTKRCIGGLDIDSFFYIVFKMIGLKTQNRWFWLQSFLLFPTPSTYVMYHLLLVRNAMHSNSPEMMMNLSESSGNNCFKSILYLNTFKNIRHSKMFFKSKLWRLTCQPKSKDRFHQCKSFANSWPCSQHMEPCRHRRQWCPEPGSSLACQTVSQFGRWNHWVLNCI